MSHFLGSIGGFVKLSEKQNVDRIGRWCCAAVLLAASSALASQTPPAEAPQATPAPAIAPQAPAPPAPPTPPAPATRAALADVYVFGRGPYLGVDVSDVTSERAKELKLSEERGAEITAVDQDAPAGKAGLKEHDVVLSLNGTRVESADQLRRMIHELPPGRNVTLGISRDGHPSTITATLGDRRALSSRIDRVGPRAHVVVPSPPFMDIEIPQIQVITSSRTVRGLTVQPLSTQLGEYFGAPNGRGLLVTSVEKGSPAEVAGLKAGDVIVRVNNDRVTDSSDWRMAIRGKSGQTISLAIIRDKREQTVTLKLPEQGANNSSEMRLMFPDYYDNLARAWPEAELAGSRAMEEAARAMEQAEREMERELERGVRDKDHELRDQQRELQRKQREQERELRLEQQRTRQRLLQVNAQ